MIIDSGIVTGSFQVIGNTEITGSLKVTGGLTGSIFGTASYANNADTVDGRHASEFVLNSATSSLATQTYVNTAVSNLVDAAPGTLDTLNELAAALGDDPNFATTVATSIGTKQNQLNGTGFVKASGTTISYDNSTYTPTSRTLTINGTSFDLSADRSWSIASGVTSFNTRTGAITLSSGDVTTALGYTPYNATNPNGYITGISFANVSSKPTTLSGYGITDAVPSARTITINGTTLDLSANRSFTVSAANADTVDGYHASGLWRSDGGVWNPGANITLGQTANGQEWSFDISRNGYTGGYWHVWDSANSTMLKVDAVSGKVSAPYNFVGALEGNASTATGLNSSNYIDRTSSSGNLNTDFQNTPAGTTRFQGDHANLTNSPGNTWWIYQNMRHSNASNFWGTQVAWGWEDNANRLATRNVTGGSFGGWVYYLNSSNYASYLDAPNKAGTSYYQTNTWIQFNGQYGLYWPNNYGCHFAPNDASSYTQFKILGSKNGYGGIYDTHSAVNGMMYDSAGNGGAYREANGRWYFYHHVGNNCTGISTSTTSSSYRAYIGGSLYAEGDIVAYSDRRKKENITTIDGALYKVNKLRGVYYNRIDDDTKKRQVGVIAQEIQEILPEVVTYAEDVDEYGVSYGNIVGVLIEAIKEQQTQIDELKELVKQLTNK